MKSFYELTNVGKAKYVVNFYDGVKQHNDGSDFYELRIFKNIPDKEKFIQSLMSAGYSPRTTYN